MLRADSCHERSDDSIGLKTLYFSVFSNQSARSVSDNHDNITVLNILGIDDIWVNIYIVRINNFAIFHV